MPDDIEQSRNHSVSFCNKLSTFELLVKKVPPVSKILRLREKNKGGESHYEPAKNKVFHSLFSLYMYLFIWARELFKANERGFRNYVGGARYCRL